MFNTEAAEAALARREESSVARAVQEIQAALTIAQWRPRDEIKAELRIVQACKRKSLAEISEYEYSRGGTRITGPTVDLIRAIASRWGNLLYGWDELSRDNGQSRVRCWAWDTQTNARAERTIIVAHWRDTSSGGHELSDERDIYENNANQAARRVRACLEEIIDSDIIDKAIDTCRQTMREGETVPLKDRAIKMLNTFAEFAVTKEMIEARLGNSLESISENQLASLRRVYRSLKDGVGKREDYFKLQPVAPQFSPPGAAGTAPPPTSPPEAPAAAPTPPPSTPAPLKMADPTPAAPAEGESFDNAAPAAAAGPEPEPSNALKAIRAACQKTKPVIKESLLLGFLAENGITDGSCATLEELQLSKPAVIEGIYKNWPDISTRILMALKLKK